MTLMRAVMLVAALAVMLPLSSAATPAQAANCEFVLGFKVIHDLIPDKVGDCLSNEFHGSNGDGLQITTAWHGKGGLLAWRKADNWTAFTDGGNTWVNGPNGLQKRGNNERFCKFEANPENLPCVDGPPSTVTPPTPKTGDPTATPQPTQGPACSAQVPLSWHEDAEKKYQYPTGWRTVRCVSGGCWGYMEPNRRAVIIHYAPLKLGAAYKLEELFYKWKADNNNKKELTLGGLEQRTVNGFPAAVQSYTYADDEGYRQTGSLFGAKNGANVYLMELYSVTSRWSEFKPIFDCAINSFVPKSAG